MEKKVEKALSKQSIYDLELVAHAKKGSEKAIKELYYNHYGYIYALLLSRTHNKTEAKDLAQEALTKAFTQLDKFDPQYAFSTWLKRIVVNHYIDFLRKKRIETYSMEEALATNKDAKLLEKGYVSETPQDILEKKQRIEAVQNVVGSMKENHRVLIDLRFFKEFTYEEIAETLGIPIGTVKARLHRAKHMLAELMLGSNPSI
ncbi:MAG: RNA polymerase subunit sigma-24 [Crocinitomicaceae bacterium]|nr:RNA polymerase subunit sigma-24 [Crocinitomicaceae bacterium]|tara:strand:- start:1670 stop:2278 length:609 start_codon:yes stop_codon:yes gene_type:complete